MTSKETKLYKIRNKETGLFSKGGTATWSLWTRGGKTWSNIGHVKNHIRHFLEGRKPEKGYPYHNAEIVEIIVKYEECSRYDVEVLVSELIK